MIRLKMQLKSANARFTGRMKFRGNGRALAIARKLRALLPKRRARRFAWLTLFA